jgi:hypothetical protein
MYRDQLDDFNIYITAKINQEIAGFKCNSQLKTCILLISILVELISFSRLIAGCLK